MRPEGGRGPRDGHSLPSSAEEGEGWRLRWLPLRLPLFDVLEGKVRLGTVFLARSVEMAGAVMFTENDSGISLAGEPTLHRRKSSDTCQLGDSRTEAQWAAFPTCLYQRDREAGRGSWAPLRASGNSRANALAAYAHQPGQLCCSSRVPRPAGRRPRGEDRRPPV